MLLRDLFLGRSGFEKSDEANACEELGYLKESL